MTKLPQFLRSRLALRQRETDEHPDANLLAGFAAQILPADERADLLEHLARCPECREVLAAASREVRKASPVAWWKWRWATAAAAACLLTALFWRPASLESPPAEKILPVPPLPSAPKKEPETKADVAKPRIASSRRAPALPKQPIAKVEPKLTLRQTLTLPPRTLNIAPLELSHALPETTGLRVPEMIPDFSQSPRQTQAEKSRQNRTGSAAPSGMFESRVHASAAKTLARQTSRPDRAKTLWTLDQALRKSDDDGRTWSVGLRCMRYPPPGRTFGSGAPVALSFIL
jgi:putative zinc finger protein